MKNIKQRKQKRDLYERFIGVFMYKALNFDVCRDYTKIKRAFIKESTCLRGY